VPKRVIDADAMWSSDKLAACAEWAQAEHAWLYGLADASGSFELTNLRVIWGRVAAIRRNFTIERLEQVFDEFNACGLLFRWESSGKRYGYWTGSDVPGRLPAPSWRMRLEKLAPPVPREELAEYLGRFSRGAKQEAARYSADRSAERPAERGEKDAAHRSAQESTRSSLSLSELKPGIEADQAQDLDLSWNQNQDQRGNSERRLTDPPHSLSQTNSNSTSKQQPTPTSCRDGSIPDYREAAEKAFAQAARSLDPWASRTAGATGNRATASSFAGESPRANQRRSPPAQPTWWQSRQDAKALQLARELNVGRGPELPPLRAPRDAPVEKSETRDEPTRAKGAANGR
jgi:hypothetical protein